MTTAIALELAKGSALAKTSREVAELASTLERARQRRNERVARADASYVEDVREAIAKIRTVAEESSIQATEGSETTQPAN